MALLAKSFRVLQPLPFIDCSDKRELILAEIALDALLACELSCLFHQVGFHGSRHAGLVDALVAHLTLEVLLSAVGRLLALLARPAQETVPDEALDECGVQIHALTVDQLVALSTLQRVVRLSHVGHSLLANLALFGVEHV